MKFFREFREFALKGNVVDLAVGVIIGAAFGKIVDSLVSDIIMPIFGAIIGDLDFSNLYIALRDIPAGVANNLAALKSAGVPVFAYGKFITISLNFIILSMIIFVMISQVNRLRRSSDAAKETAPPAPAEDIVLLRGILDVLKTKKK